MLGGPIGGLIGLALAEFLANDQSEGKVGDQFRTGGRSKSTSHVQPGDFHVSLLVLSAIVIKADGIVDKRELNFVRDRFVQMFGKDKANQSFEIFKSIVNKDIKITPICEQIRRNMAHSSRLQLIYFLFGVAGADGHTDPSEIETIHRIARNLYISDIDFEAIRATFLPKNDLSSSYKILEIDENATETEIKKAYRKMAVKFHPDKLEHLGEDVQKAAKEKFIKVQEAYELICKKKGIR